MLGLMQDQPLLISSLIEFAARHHASAEIVSRRVEGDLHRYTYRGAAARARRVGAGHLDPPRALGRVVGPLRGGDAAVVERDEDRRRLRLVEAVQELLAAARGGRGEQRREQGAVPAARRDRARAPRRSPDRRILV